MTIGRGDIAIAYVLAIRGYRFSDYLKVGVPLDLLILAITVAIAPLACTVTGGSTTTYGWFQTYGNALALSDIANVGTGVQLFTSSVNPGYVMNTTAGAVRFAYRHPTYYVTVVLIFLLP